MSRIGKNPIDIPAGVTVSVDGQDVAVKGPKGVKFPHIGCQTGDIPKPDIGRIRHDEIR